MSSETLKPVEVSLNRSLLFPGAFDTLFKEQPPGELVVHRGEDVELRCITNEDATCAWKLETSQLGISGFLSSRVSRRSFLTLWLPGSTGLHRDGMGIDPQKVCMIT